MFSLSRSRSAFPSVRVFPVVLLALLVVFLSHASLMAESLIVPVVTGFDGYTIDTDADESGNVKIAGSKVNDMPIGETATDSNEARVWLPFVLDETQRAFALQSDVSVTLKFYLSNKLNIDGLTVGIYGSGYRSAYLVNQSDYATLVKELVPNAITASTETGILSFDVTEFVREEAARPDAAGLAFGFLLRVEDESLLPNSDTLQNAFLIGSSRRTDATEVAQLVMSHEPAVTNPADLNPSDPAAVRILIIGNSILKNGPKAEIGWAGNWGMAASAEDKDFVHILMDRISTKIDRPVEFMIHNMAFWENTWSVIRHDIPLVTFARDFNPDIILSCISENTGLHDHQVAGYKEKYREMISIIACGADGEGDADVIVRGSFWTINANTDLALSEVATEEGYPYVRCDFLGTERANQAWEADYYLGPDPVQDSVFNHPSDAGMQAIADEIWNTALEALLEQKYVPADSTSGYFQWDSIFNDETDIFLIGPDYDFDQDGENNFAEYAFLSDPKAASGTGLSRIDVVTSDGLNFKSEVTFLARQDDPDLRYAIEWSNDMVDWSSADLVFTGTDWILQPPDAAVSLETSQRPDGSWELSVGSQELLEHGLPLIFKARAFGAP